METRTAFDEIIAAYQSIDLRSTDSGCIVVGEIESPLGLLIAGATDKGICLLEFTDPQRLRTQFATLHRRFKIAIVPGKHDYLTRLQAELEAYFAGDLKRFTVPLDLPGTPFQRKVWNALLEIPYGATRTYQQIAEQIGSANAQRAVGKANGDNPLAILIPCHRLVGSDGQLRGYGGGLWRKRALLSLEQGEPNFEDAGQDSPTSYSLNLLSMND